MPMFKFCLNITALLFVSFLVFHENAFSQSASIADSAAKLIQQEKYKDAVNVLRDGLSKQKTDVSLLRLLAAAYSGMQEYGDAIEAYRDAAKIASCDTCYSDYEYAGMISADLHRNDDAVSYLQLALQKGSPTARALMAQVYFNAGEEHVQKQEYSSALKEYMHGLAYSQDTLLYQRIMLCYFQLDDRESLWRLSDTLLLTSPGFTAPLAFRASYNLRVANKELRHENYEEAQKYYIMVIRDAPSSAPAYYGLGFCYEKLKDTTKAVGYFEQAVDLGIAESACYYDLGNLYFKRNRLPEAEKSLRNALLRDNNLNSVAYWRLLSDVYVKMGELKKSVACTRMADGLMGIHRSPFGPDTKELESILNDSSTTTNIVFDDGPDSETAKKAVDKLPEDLKFDKPPVLTSPITLNYPEIAVRAGVEGSVWVKMLVDTNGTVKKALVSKSDAEIFNDSAIECAMKSRFTPAMLHNIPVAAWTVIEYPFKLKH